MRWIAALCAVAGLLAGPARAAVTGVSLAVSPASPQPAYTTMRLTATPIGGVSVQYRFRVGYALYGTGIIWSTLRDYNGAATCTWTPTVARYYTLEVSAREAGTLRTVIMQRAFQVTAGTPTPPNTGGRITFISERNGNAEIYSMKSDGSGQTRLTNTPALEMEQAMSPDGKKIAFVSRRTGTFELFSMNADGSGVLRLTTNGQADWGPTYTPNGARLLFFRTINGTDEIFSMAATGGNEIRLTNNSWFDVLPVMTPDGKTIIFNSDRNGSTRQANYDIYSMNPDGTGQRRLTTNPGQDWYHAISPDGKSIAYTCDDHINIMNIDGTNPRRLTTPRGYRDDRPTFSPDGKKIAFASNRDGNWEIYVMNADGTGQTRLTNSPGADYYPCWGPG